MSAGISKDDPAYDGQAVYTAGFLRIYDLLVLQFNGNVAWRCSPGRLVRMYNDNVSAKHLDIGVGTGYFLDKCRYPSPSPDITLMDLNPNSLEAAAKRISRSTVLTGGVPHTWFSRWMMDQLNDGNHSFSNRDDDLETLKAQLEQRFHDVTVEVVGSVAIFSGRN
jgi:hypothetical protein